MVVVEQGRDHIGARRRRRESVLQTSAGRMIFARYVTTGSLQPDDCSATIATDPKTILSLTQTCRQFLKGGTTNDK